MFVDKGIDTKKLVVILRLQQNVWWKMIFQSLQNISDKLWKLSGCYLFNLGRDIRSTLHFSPKNLRIQKWSLSAKNGSKHPMSSILMADNVISYKKIKRNAKENKIADFTI